MSEPYAETYADLVEAPYLGPPLPVVIRPSEPMPVEPRAARSWATGKMTVDAGRTVQLAPAHPARSRIVITARPRLAETLSASGAVTAPTAAGPALATIPAPAAGLYRVTIQGHYGGTATGQDRANIGLYRGSSLFYTLPLAGVGSGTTGGYHIAKSPDLTLRVDGTQDITARAIADGSAAAVYVPGITAEPITSAAQISIGQTEDTTPGGMLVPPGAPVTLTHRGAVWVRSDVPCDISYSAEYLDG